MPEWLAAIFSLALISAFVYDLWKTFR